MFGYKPSVTVNKTTKIVDNTVTKEKTDFLEITSNNLFNKYDFIANTTINTETGELIPDPYHNISGFIKVEPSTKYVFANVVRYVQYDKNKNFTASFGGGYGYVTTRSDTEYIRLIYGSHLMTGVQFNKGEVLAPYDEYCIKLNGMKVSNSIQNTRNDDKFIVIGELDGTYTAPEIPAKLDMHTMVSTDIYTLYDALVTAHPDYVSKTALGLNSLGATIYRYDFKSPEVPIVNSYLATVKKPKMILISGVHGEKAGVYNLYQTMKQICTAWQTEPLLETLHWNVEFIVVPIVNLYGFDNNTRKNENGVDIARNFTEKWELASDNPLSDTYRGTAPLSELESQYIDELMQVNNDAILFASYHNFYAPSLNEYFIWGSAGSMFTVQIYKNLISMLSRKWKKDYDWLPQDDTTYFGYSSLSVSPGSEGMQAVAYGIQGGIFEVCSAFYLEPGYANYDSIALTLGLEAFVNYLILALKHCVAYYNSDASKN